MWHRTSMYICHACLRPVVMSPMLVPDQRTGRHSCTRPSGIYDTIQLQLTSSHVFISCTQSACKSVTVSSYQHPCMLHLHPTICHVSNSCIPPFAMSLTVAPNQQLYLLNLHLQACMSDTLAPGQHSYLL